MQVWVFIITAILFPTIAIIAFAINGGEIEVLTQPLGKFAGMVFISVCFLTLGVLFGTPRTATIRYEVITNGEEASLIQKTMFSTVFFGLVGIILVKTGKLLR